MNRGYIKLWRKTLDSGLVQHPNAFALFGYLLLGCAWRKKKYATKYGIIQLREGQMATGRKKLASDLNQSEQNIRTALGLLEKMKILTIESTNGYSIITLENWDKYQSCEDEITSGLTNGQPTPNQRLTTDKEYIEYKKDTHDDFEPFWARYPRKVNRASAVKAWQKLSPESRQTATTAIEAHAAKWRADRTEEKFIPHASTWLNQQRYMDPTEPPKRKGPAFLQPRRFD
jgi:hypothetical protein